MKRWLPFLITSVFGLWMITGLLPRSDKTFAVQEFGRLPVLLNGRVQPLDSVARNSLLLMRERQSVAIEGGRMLTATEWLMEVLMKPQEADQRKIFRIDHPQLLDLLRLPRAEKYFSFLQIQPQFEKLQSESERAHGIESALRNPYDRAVVKLAEGVFIYHRLKHSLQPEGVKDFASLVSRYKATIPTGIAAVHAQAAREKYDEDAFNAILDYLGYFQFLSRAAYPLLVPPSSPEISRDAWENVGTSLMESARRGGEIHPAIEYYARMSSAYHAGKQTDFNRAVAEYRQWLAVAHAPEVSKGRREFFFSQFEPFYKCMWLYVAAFLLACSYWFNLTDWLRRSAFGLVLLALAVHTAGLIFRMALEGRPPVTNLYSSAIFIGWGAVVLGVVLERFYRDSIGLVVAGVVGFSTLIIAHNLAFGGDTMEMLRAVLDTNFWLATHVVCITIGYASTFVAGFLAIIYIVRGALTRTLSDELAKSLVRMVYGIVCFATLFSFVGTILGGLWADQSWGRFWGWDVKENGALLIVIWNAAYLHARWGKVFPERGLMAMAVFGNIVTSFSWFGVNMLGVGLHSYGFMDAAFKSLVIFDISQLLLIALALVPTRFWMSFREQTVADLFTSGPAKNVKAK